MYARTKQQQNSGFVALISAILISVSLLILTVAVSFEGYHSRFSILESQQKEASTYLAEACINTAILKIAQNIHYAGNETIPVGGESCKIVSAVQGTFPTERIIKAKGISGDAVTNLRVEASFLNSPDIDIDIWEEVASF